MLTSAFKDSIKGILVGIINGTKIGTVYECMAEPNISIYDYIDRLSIYMVGVHKEYIWDLVWYYIQLLINNKKVSQISYKNVHRIVAIAVLIGLKTTNEYVYTNTWYSHILGLHLTEVNLLERQFLKDVDWRVQLVYNNDSRCGCVEKHHNKGRITGPDENFGGPAIPTSPKLPG